MSGGARKAEKAPRRNWSRREKYEKQKKMIESEESLKKKNKMN